ncbi:hypothetical protein COLO4_29726 [Corchorus olitorius]|uniref:Uncharacterized protein n=1 Tax=Corchorus olitorius TaxID=93759 RepID=A0A1R3HDF1_9ROSI|nr:hypothetical protein COLO4_29726 [Corchorus olitorius]
MAHEILTLGSQWFNGTAKAFSAVQTKPNE